ncbi:Hypothetical predicted protein [Mytilus galloprovincialis]|uniref:Fibrinogen C-terminal domain-containing protein n=1 Tax=Mytilus galloprovincialis TaxID=29158 RepID=A0A8B6EF72_MYTGA|nr:Hypothetical predicted protein [Mytilus galloprovincialis]
MVVIKRIFVCVFLVSLLVGETTQEPEGRPNDCNDIPDKCPSGVYKVFPNQTKGFDVYCEMNLDKGHWTVFQRRENGYVDFYRGWNDYKLGFGNPKLDRFNRFRRNTAFAKYKNFAIGDESSKFKLTVNGYHGTAGNNMEYHSGHGFSTKDSDNDIGVGHCALDYRGAWWFNKCVTADLNGQYFLKTPDSVHRGVYWLAFIFLSDFISCIVGAFTLVNIDPKKRFIRQSSKKLGEYEMAPIKPIEIL